MQNGKPKAKAGKKVAKGTKKATKKGDDKKKKFIPPWMKDKKAKK